MSDLGLPWYFCLGLINCSAAAIEQIVIKHKWIVFVAAFMATFLNFGFTVAMGAMFTSMLDTFNAGRAKTALVQSLVAAISFGFGVVSGFLISKFGIRVFSFLAALLTATGFFLSYFATSIYQLYGFISIITGIGFSTMYVSAVVCVGWSFTGRQKTIVLAIESMGTAVSGFMWPFLLTASIEAYGLRGTFLILCGIFLNNIPIAIIFSKVNVKTDEPYTKSTSSSATLSDIHENGDTASVQDGSNTTKYEESSHIFHTTVDTISNSQREKAIDGNNSKNKRTKKENIRDLDTTKYGSVVTASKHESFLRLCCSRRVRLYMLYVLCSVLAISSVAGFLAVYQDININNGLSISQSDLTFLSYSLMNILSRLLPMIPAKFTSINIFAIPIVSLICGTLGQILFLTQTSFAGSIVGMGLTAIEDGGVSACNQVILFQILPKRYQAVGFGFLCTAIGVSVAVTGPIFGSIRDGTSSYQTVLISTSLVMFIGAVLSFVCLLISSSFVRNAVSCFTTKKKDDSM